LITESLIYVVFVIYVCMCRVLFSQFAFLCVLQIIKMTFITIHARPEFFLLLFDVVEKMQILLLFCYLSLSFSFSRLVVSPPHTSTHNI
jgi:hypothetical protein